MSTDLEKTIEFEREMLAQRPPGHAKRFDFLYQLSNHLYAHFNDSVTRRQADLDEVIELDREALALPPDSDEVRLRILVNLSVHLDMRFKQRGRDVDLNEAITLDREALTLQPPGHPHRSMTLERLRVHVDTRYRWTGRKKDLAESIELGRAPLALRSTGLQDQPLDSETQFPRSEMKVDRNETIQLHRESLGFLTHDHPERASTSLKLAVDLHARFLEMSKQEDLDEAIELGRESLALRPLGHQDRSVTLFYLAIHLHEQFAQMGRKEDLDEAIKLDRECLSLQPPGHPDRSWILLSLSVHLHTQFLHAGCLEDLDEEIELDRECLELRPPGHPERSWILFHGALHLAARFKERGVGEDLEEAIIMGREVLALRVLGHPNRAESLMNLASDLVALFDQKRMEEDLDEAIELDRECLTLLPAGNADRPKILGNMAVHLHTRFAQTGRKEDLDEAIELDREALVILPPDHPEQPWIMENVAVHLNARFTQTGRKDDLDEAIQLGRALALRTHSNADRSRILLDLGSHLGARYNYLWRREDLDEAIELDREALALLPPGPKDRSWILDNMAIHLNARFMQTGRKEDLDEAIDLVREALAIFPPGRPDRSRILTNLARFLASRATTSEEFREAIEYLMESEASLPALHPSHGWHRFQIADVCLRYHDRHPDVANLLSEVFLAYDTAANHPTSSLTDRLAYAHHWAWESRRRGHESSLTAYSVCLDLINRISVQIPTLESQRKSIMSSIKDQKYLASDAVSHAIGLGDLETAIQMSEQGRGILWRKIREYRHPLLRLREAHPDHAKRFEALSAQLESYVMTSESSDSISLSQPLISFDTRQRSYNALSVQYNRVVAEIRAFDDFDDFLQASAFATLQQAAAEGPVIVININNNRSDAIIVHRTDDPVLVPLPDAAPDGIAKLSSHFADPRASGIKTFSEGLKHVLKELWRTIVGPVVKQLKALQVSEKSRIWWCPTSDLCALPIHAAGPYLPKERNLPDLYVSSYTPTLSALIQARSSLIPKTSAPKLLVVGQPDGGSIPAVGEEVRRIQSIVPTANVLINEGANKAATLSGLNSHSWAHFACHGRRHPEPFHSSFKLHDGESLELIELIKARLPDAELAFVSACHGAAVDIEGTPDETINLSAALQFCGFRSVVGTLWAMADEDGPNLAEEFYRHMFRDLQNVDFRDAATALNLATKQMRRRAMTSTTRDPTILSRWVNFVHIGA